MIEYVVGINDVRFCTFVCLRLLDISKKLKAGNVAAELNE